GLSPRRMFPHCNRLESQRCFCPERRRRRLSTLFGSESPPRARESDLATRTKIEETQAVPGTRIESKIDTNSAAFQRNTRDMISRLTEIKSEEEKIKQGGGVKAIEGQHKKGRLTARERIAKLIDAKSEFFELAIYAAYEMYQDWGGAPS